MRNHIRREAGQSQAAYWLVPVAFAVAALAAVALIDPAAPPAGALPPQPAVTTASPAPAAPSAQPADTSVQLQEHVQAF
jgi:hypothetical protein